MTKHEDTWHALWQERALSELPPSSMALEAGRLADRLAWVFVAGYQAAIHSTFTQTPKDAWSAFAVSEDKKDRNANPPSRIRREGDRWFLNGTKSWVAASAHLKHLFVTAKEITGDEEKRHLVLIKADQPGVTLTHREAPGFLRAMSQGYARFENVEVEPHNILDIGRAHGFGDAEPPFIMLASTAFLIAHAGADQQYLKDQLAELSKELTDYCNGARHEPKVIAELDKTLQFIIEIFSANVECSTIPDWDADKMLLSMYSRRLQKASAAE